MTESTNKANTTSVVVTTEPPGSLENRGPVTVITTGLPGMPHNLPVLERPLLWTKDVATQEAERALELRDEAQKRAREMPPDVRNTKDGQPVPFVPAHN